MESIWLLEGDTTLCTKNYMSTIVAYESNLMYVLYRMTLLLSIILAEATVLSKKKIMMRWY